MGMPPTTGPTVASASGPLGSAPPGVPPRIVPTMLLATPAFTTSDAIATTNTARLFLPIVALVVVLLLLLLPLIGAFAAFLSAAFAFAFALAFAFAFDSAVALAFSFAFAPALSIPVVSRVFRWRLPLGALTVDQEDNAALEFEGVWVRPQELLQSDTRVLLELRQRFGELIEAATSAQPLQHVSDVDDHGGARHVHVQDRKLGRCVVRLRFVRRGTLGVQDLQWTFG
mmetsp:Transcript_103444/g.331667  ORF Transcript_103444/g.331667 Transcript_103444/m.331667 type:complete len:228 (+) Transcript_103444:315-998(+)